MYLHNRVVTLGELAFCPSALWVQALREAHSTRKPNHMQHHVSMNKDAKAICSRMPSVMPSAMDMMLAEIEYSTHRQ